MKSMKSRRILLGSIAIFAAASSASLPGQTPTPTSTPPATSAGDPIIQTKFTADPAPMVHDGVVYLYTGHDEDDATHFTMHDWQCYSSTDMVNWTALPPPALANDRCVSTNSVNGSGRFFRLTK